MKHLGLITAILLIGIIAVPTYIFSFKSANDACDTYLNYTIIRVLPHDPSSFTQGLFWYNGQLIESTGLYGSSTLRSVNLTTGEVTRIRKLYPTYFGEGITIHAGRIYQLTWKNNRCIVYDIDSFMEEKVFSYEYEGWGLTNNGTYLILSDGTSILRYIDPSSFKVVKIIEVHDGNIPVSWINELEYVDDKIFANILQSDTIVIIDPKTGKIINKIDFSKLRDSSWKNADALNGIAYDSVDYRLFITGKLWPSLFEVKLIKL